MSKSTSKKEKKQKKTSQKSQDVYVEKHLKRLPPPPREHAYELKMEKRLKRVLEEQSDKGEA